MSVERKIDINATKEKPIFKLNPYTRKIRQMIMTIILAGGTLLYADFSTELNPTGDPLGGGPGYSDIITTGDYIATTAEELRDMLTLAQSGDVVFIPGHLEIDVTDVANAALIQVQITSNNQPVIVNHYGLRIPGGVTVASDRGREINPGSGVYSPGARLYTTKTMADGGYIFKTANENARVTGLRLEGPSTSSTVHQLEWGGIKTFKLNSEFGFGLIVDNCELWNWSSDAVVASPSDRCWVHHNYIHHNRKQGHGYGAFNHSALDSSPPGANPGESCLQGATPETTNKPTENEAYGASLKCEMRIEANIFNWNRHSIVGASNPSSSYRARYNVELGNALAHNFDRHGGGGGTRCGWNTFVENNWFRSFALNLKMRASAWGEVTFSHNWCDQSGIDLPVELHNTNTECEDIDVSTCALAHDCDCPEFLRHFPSCITDFTPENTPCWFSAENNKLGGVGVNPPVAQFKIQNDLPAVGLAPLTLTFEDDGSTASRTYHWRIHDTPNDMGVQSSESSITHTFAEPGVYNVSLFITDDHGVPSRPANKIITVEPATPTHWLSAWIKDDHTNDTLGTYMIQILIDDQLVWEEDAAGDLGWRHVSVDVSSKVQVGLDAKVQFRIVTLDGSAAAAEDGIINLFVDDVYLFGAEDLPNPGFELSSAPPWLIKTSPAFSGSSTLVRTSAEARQGRVSAGLKLKDAGTDDYTEIYQFTLVEALAPLPGAANEELTWTFDESDDNNLTVLDQSGNGLSGTLQNTFPDPARLGVGASKALQFNGSGYVSANTQPPLAHEMAIALWVQVDENTTNTQSIVDYCTTSCRGYSLFVDTDGKPVFQLRGKTGMDIIGKVKHDTVVTDGLWHFIVGVINYETEGSEALSGKGRVSIYVDGVKQPADGDEDGDDGPEGDDFDITTVNLGGKTFRIGQERHGKSALTGQMDEIRIFDRALFPIEVLEMYE